MLGARSVAAAVLALGALGLLAGCGEKSEPPTTGPVVTQTTTGPTTTPTTTSPNQQQGGGGPAATRATALAAVRRFLMVPNDPKVCDQMTPAFLRGSYGNRSGCVASRKPGAMAKSISTPNVAMKGNAATVEVRPKGGVFAGEKLKITLVKSNQGWKIDRISSNAKVGP